MRDRGKNIFSAGCLVFFVIFKDAQGLLFYSKCKVWQISEKKEHLRNLVRSLSPLRVVEIEARVLRLDVASEVEVGRSVVFLKKSEKLI